MTVRRANFLLHVATVTLALLAVAVIAGSILLPLPGDADDDVVRGGGRATSRPAASALPPLPEFAAVWSRRLRPSFDPPTTPDAIDGPAAVQAASPAATGAFALVGTIGDSTALIRDAAGNVEARSVGENVAGMGVVVAVRPSEVDVQSNGQLLTLRRSPDANPIQANDVEIGDAAPVLLPPAEAPDPSADDPRRQAIVDGE